MQESLAMNREMEYNQNEHTLLKSISEVYAKLNQHQKAYEYATQAFDLKDSLTEAQNKKTVADMQEKYETEKKNQQISLLTKDNEIKELDIRNQKVMSFSLLGGVVLLAILAFVWWKQYKLKLETSQLLAEQNMELERLNATKDKLFALIAHDLKNPLSAFRSITQSLNDNLNAISKDDINYFLAELNNSANNLYDLLQNLLTWAISQIDQLPMQSEALNVREVVGETVSLLELNSQAKQLEMVVNVDEDVTVKADKNMLRTVLRNLVGNAIKFTPEGGKVTITARQSGSTTKLSVVDTGIGMSETDAAKLFKVEEDVSTVGDAPEKGTGLGLILCNELLDKQGGSIAVESEFGKGSTFTVELAS